MAIPKFLQGLSANNKRIQAIASPTTGTDAANKAYVDALVEGLSYKNEVRCATTANGALATVYENGDTIDGITLATNDRILIKDQTTQTENGIYTVNASGAPTRAIDADSTIEMNNATVYVLQGTVNAGREYTQTTINPTLGTNNIVWAQKGVGGTTYTADGQGIELTSTTFGLELDGTTLSKSATGLKINESVVVRKGAANCAATTNPQTFAHGAGSLDVLVEILESGSVVYPDVTVDTTNITVDWGGAPTASQYRVLWHF
jgi:hypothetical protein